VNAYSEDLRMKIVQALRRGMGNSQAARTFSVSLSSIKRYAKMAEEGGSLAPKNRPGSKPKIDERSRKLLQADLEEHPFLTLQQRCEYLRRVEHPRGGQSLHRVPSHKARMDATPGKRGQIGP
jgi:transposase